MTTTLSYGATTLTLPSNLLWTDEFAWRQVEQRGRYTLTGALILESAVRQAGRPITLAAGSSFGWVTRNVVLTLKEWAAVPGRQMTLVLRGEPPRTVVFDHASGAIEAPAVVDYADPADDDFYVLTVRFLQV